jgi:hypothetical protein
MRNRTLVSGDTGTGKTLAALSVADEMLTHSPNMKIEIIDLDDSLEQELERFPDVKARLANSEGKLVHWHLCAHYDALLAATTKVQQTLGEGDLLIIEGLERGWELAQDKYTEDVFGRTSGEHLATLRAARIAAGQDSAPASYDSARDWPSIRKMWKNDILFKLTVAVKWSVIATSAAKAIVSLDSRGEKWNVNPYQRGIFGTLGVVPEGEKSDSKRFEAVVMLGYTREGFEFSVAKNRYGERRTPHGVVWTNRPFWATVTAAAIAPQAEEEEEKEEVAPASTK